MTAHSTSHRRRRERTGRPAGPGLRSTRWSGASGPGCTGYGGGGPEGAVEGGGEGGSPAGPPGPGAAAAEVVDPGATAPPSAPAPGLPAPLVLCGAPGSPATWLREPS